MGRYNNLNEGTILGEALVWTVVERAANPTLCAPQVLIGWQVQARLDGGVIEKAVVFATRDIREVGHISDDRPGAILAIEAQQRARGRKAVGFHVRLDGRLRLP